jgi:hypothetical protein
VLGSEYRPVASLWENSIEPLSFIKYGEYLEQLSNYQLLKKDSAHSSYVYRAEAWKESLKRRMFKHRCSCLD